MTQARKWNGKVEVQAAGGVVWRVRSGVLEVAIVHRPKYGDWSFPKGKLDPGESHEQGAIREVEEETGLRCVLGHELSTAHYRDSKGRSKTVRYWEMTVAGGEFTANPEVDEIRWLSVVPAAAILSYSHDIAVLESFARFAGEPAPPR